MPQQMRPFEIGVQSGALEAATNHTTNGGYVPKHASWLNMVEIEIGVLASQCLVCSIESRRKLAAEKPLGSSNATPPAPASNGCSRPRKPAPKWVAPIRGSTPN